MLPFLLSLVELLANLLLGAAAVVYLSGPVRRRLGDRKDRRTMQWLQKYAELHQATDEALEVDFERWWNSAATQAVLEETATKIFIDTPSGPPSFLFDELRPEMERRALLELREVARHLAVHIRLHHSQAALLKRCPKAARMHIEQESATMKAEKQLLHEAGFSYSDLEKQFAPS